MSRTLATFTLLLISCAILQADDWPAWRGPTGQGFCNEKNVPLKWSDKTNVKWKVELKNQGNSTPIVYGDKIFLTQANKGGSVRSLICLSRKDGKPVWQKDVEYKDKETNWNQSWYCNASPVTDGKRVVACFGSAGVYCYDYEGKELWKRTDLGKWEDQFGNSSSPVIYNDYVIQWCGPNRTKGKNFLLAMKKEDGKTAWEHQESYGSWSTPLIVKIDKQDQLLLGQARDVKGSPESKWGYLKGFDPKSGNELWKCQGLSSFVYTSPLYAEGVAVMMSGYMGSAIAVKLGGSGDITKDRLWLHPENVQRVGSGMIIGQHVYMVDEDGSARCYDLKSGEEVWNADQKRGTTWGSMVHAEGRLYVLMRNGETRVFAAKPKYELLATNTLSRGEETNSSLAISDGEIFIRTFKHLWCISDKK